MPIITKLAPYRLAAAVVVGGLAVSAAIAAVSVSGKPAFDPIAVDRAGFTAERCRLLTHHRRQLDGEAARLAEAELGPIFERIDGRVAEFADWAFRWRTSYSLLRRSVLGGVGAVTQGESLPDRLRTERDSFVEEAYRSIVLRDEDQALNMAALHWRQRLGREVSEIDLDHRTAITMFLGFDPQLDVGQPQISQSPSLESLAAAAEARDLATSRAARPLLVRTVARLSAAALPSAMVPEILGETALLPAAPISLVALLSVDYLISRIDAHVSRDAFITEIRAAHQNSRHIMVAQWAGIGQQTIEQRLAPRRAALSAMAGIGGCPDR
ncbi:hypothetical protein MCP1_400023 [Candidatus Terasakiella magnetica]|nr:hypothetical protein MCP1_400023 [Candidatus Terasakiella magnetica]